jgi:replicative DNA helicase
MAAAVRRTFGAAADAVADALSGSLSLEEGLQRVADGYGDSPEQLARATEQLAALRVYTTGIVRRESVRAYLSAAELTSLEVIESARRELLLIADDPHSLFDAARTERFELLWQEFQAHYAEHYADVHARAVGDACDHKELDEFTRGAAWRDFEALAGLPFVAPQLWEEATALIAEVKNARCDLPTAGLLAKRPRCACAFRLARAAQYLNAAPLLAEITERGRAAYRRSLARFHAHLTHALNRLATDASDAKTASRAYALAHRFAQRQTPEHFTHTDVRLITRALEKTPPAEPLRVRLPGGIVRGLVTRDELAARWQQWFDELPHDAALVEIIVENNSDAA